jgi:hypothetical protein
MGVTGTWFAGGGGVGKLVRDGRIQYLSRRQKTGFMHFPPKMVSFKFSKETLAILYKR